MAHVQVCFDYGSPYSYLAWARITRVHPERYHGHDVEWTPVSAGHLFKMDGSRPNTLLPNQKRHLLWDMARWTRAYGIPFAPPPDGAPGAMPVHSLSALRLHFVAADEGTAKERAWLDAVYLAYFRDGKDISDAAILDALAQGVGLPGGAARAHDADAKARLAATTRVAYEAGAPGVPYVILDDEGYWGNDRLAWVEARLAGEKDAPPGI